MGKAAIEAVRRRAVGFDPAKVGRLEARGWQAYYARRWPRMALLLYRLVRTQLGLSPVAAVRAVRHGARAALAFAPAKNDPDAARAELRRFYAVARAATGLPFDPDAAGDAEFDYWVIHREIVGQEDRAPLVEALAGIPAAVYGLPADAFRPSAVERERAVALVDRITSGVHPPTEAAWQEIARTLERSHDLLRRALLASWVPETGPEPRTPPAEAAPTPKPVT
jgi:hypothetical protein